MISVICQLWRATGVLVKRFIRNSAGVIFGAVALTSALGGVASAGADTARSADTPATKSTGTSGGPAAEHCHVVLGKVKPGEKSSRVVSRTCSNDRADLGVNAWTLLIVLYEHPDYGGRTLAVSGQYGPCDSEGYGFFNTGAWGVEWMQIISSFRTYGNCNYTRAYQGFDYTGTNVTYYGWRAYVGDTMDNKIKSFWVSA